MGWDGWYYIIPQSYFSISLNPLGILEHHLVASIYSIGLFVYTMSIVPIECYLVLTVT